MIRETSKNIELDVSEKLIKFLCVFGNIDILYWGYS